MEDKELSQTIQTLKNGTNLIEKYALLTKIFKPDDDTLFWYLIGAKIMTQMQQEIKK